MEDVPRDSRGTMILAMYFGFKTIPYLVSGLAIFLGYKLFLAGVGGQASLAVEATTIKGQLINAAPGLFFSVGGIISMIISTWKGVQVRFGKDGMPGDLNVNIPRSKK